MTSDSDTWMRTLVQHYIQDGSEALGDGRHENTVTISSCRHNHNANCKKPGSAIHPMEGSGQDPGLPVG